MTGPFQRRVTTTAIAAAGVAVFLVLQLPLPFLLGPMSLCLAAALGGARLEGLGVLGSAFRTVLGVAAGAAITPDVVQAVPGMALSLAVLPAFVLCTALVSYPLMRRGFGFDPVTSYYGAMPGGLQDLLVFGEEAGANARALSLIHATRVLFIVSIAPFVLGHVWGVDLLARPGVDAADSPPVQIVLLIAAGLGGWAIARRLNLFGASIIGPMVLTAALSLAGIITQRPPAEMIWACQFALGIGVGAKYAGVTWGELRRVVLAGIANGAALAAVSALFILGVAAAGLAPSLEAFLAFLPGGQGEMVVLAIIAGADLTYVVLIHIFRVALVVMLAPLLMTRLVRG